MKKFIIEESERERILGMHKSATKKQYLGEQTNQDLEQKPPYNQITWADNKKGLSTYDINAENENTLIKYYKEGDIIGKTAFLFKQGPTEPINLKNIFTTFEIKGVQEKDSGIFLLSKSITEPEPANAPYVRILKDKVWYHANNRSGHRDVVSPISVLRSAEVKLPGIKN
jgi:hypothetical protein